MKQTSLLDGLEMTPKEEAERKAVLEMQINQMDQGEVLDGRFATLIKSVDALTSRLDTISERCFIPPEPTVVKEPSPKKDKPVPASKFHKKKYDVYMQSPKWINLRKAKIAQVGGRCQMCNAEENLRVHHNNYDRVFKERLSDLTVLCEECHEDHHAKKSG
jgi:hypothetical protein